MHVGRKFIAFVLCLITFIVMGIVGKGEGMAPYIVGLFVAYCTGNVAHNATSKPAQFTSLDANDVEKGAAE